MKIGKWEGVISKVRGMFNIVFGDELFVFWLMNSDFVVYVMD